MTLVSETRVADPRLGDEGDLYLTGEGGRPLLPIHFGNDCVSLFTLRVTAILITYKTPFKVLRIWRRNGTDPEIL